MPGIAMLGDAKAGKTQTFGPAADASDHVQSLVSGVLDFASVPN